MKERLLGTSGFPLGGSCQRPRPLADEGKACGSCLLRVCNGKTVPHPALRGHLPPRGKALIDQYPICRFAAFSALRSGLYLSLIHILDIPADVYTIPYAVKTIQKALAAKQGGGANA